MKKNMLQKSVRRRWLNALVPCLLLMGIAFEAGAQQGASISGMVRDDKGIPLSGVSVRLVNDSLQVNLETGTGSNGMFTFNGIKPGDGYELRFSYMGFKSKNMGGYSIGINDRLSLAVQLEATTEEISEVVVIGYGDMARKDLTSSITTVKSEDLNQGVFSSPAQLLQGKVPGLVISTNNSNPNATPSVTLRGSSTLRAGEAAEPYYVIDGVPGASLSLVAPDDIESIDVLRDASATAIYGSKASNGVIIVTTKKGKSGQSGISYNGYVAVDKVAKHMDMMNASQYRQFILDNGFSLEPDDDRGADTDWQRAVERSGVSNNHNISIIGGSEKTNYNASINSLKNQGVIMGSDMERQIGRGFVQTKAMDDRLDLSFNFNLSQTEQNDVLAEGQGLSVYDAMYYYLPMSPVKTENGAWFEKPDRSQYVNPVSLIEENTIFSKTKLLQAHAKAGYEILPGLKYNLDLSFQNRQLNHSRYYSSKSMAAREMNGQAIRAAVEDERRVMEMNFSYDKTFADVHRLSALAGYSWEENNNNDGFQLTTSDYYDDHLLYYNPGMANNVDLNGFGGYYLSTLRMISFYSRVNYSYDSRYLLQATLRRDGSSAFGANNRWATFPSLSAAWRISEEPFIKTLNVFNDLKFRVGYGVSGNSLGFDVFTATQVYGASQNWYTDSEGNQLRTLAALRNANPDLKWERTGMLNLGLDFGFLNNRLSGTIEYYDKNTTDLIYDYAVSTTKYLYGSLTANVGEINNKGVEFSLNAVPVKTEHFSWNTGLNLSHNKNVVKRISNDEFSVDYIDLSDLGGAGQTNAFQQRLIEGAPIGQFYTWEWAGYNDEGVSVFYVRDEETGERTGETTITPMMKDRAATGSAQPKLTLGWNNNFAYKQLTVNALFQGVFGHKIMNGTQARHSNVVGNAGNRNLLASVLETERMTDINAHYLSDRYLEKGDYLRLASLSFAYNLRSLGRQIKNVRLSATVNNVFVLSNYKGNDPEVNLGGLTPGIDNRQTYPRTRTFIFGVNFNL